MRGYFISFALLMSLAPLRAQVLSGTISGVVSDAFGAVVPEASVQIVNANTNVKARSGATSQAGAFLAPVLNVGSYNISIEAPGFRKFEILALLLEQSTGLAACSSLSALWVSGKFAG